MKTKLSSQINHSFVLEMGCLPKGRLRWYPWVFTRCNLLWTWSG